eukprot:6383284-Amphidinium_carterae.1
MERWDHVLRRSMRPAAACAYNTRDFCKTTVSAAIPILELGQIKTSRWPHALSHVVKITCKP